MFCDLPSVPPGPVGKFLLTQVAAVAEVEAGLISQRRRRGGQGSATRNTPGTPEHARAAAAAKSAQARVRAADVIPYIEAARGAGARTLRELAEALSSRGVPTPAGKGPWRPEQVRRLLGSCERL